MQAAMGSLSNISIASLKNSIDEVRAQVYPRNETEKKVPPLFPSLFDNIV